MTEKSLFPGTTKSCEKSARLPLIHSTGKQ
jgi:hypothetical protein